MNPDSGLNEIDRELEWVELCGAVIVQKESKYSIITSSQILEMYRKRKRGEELPPNYKIDVLHYLIHRKGMLERKRIELKKYEDEILLTLKIARYLGCL